MGPGFQMRPPAGRIFPGCGPGRCPDLRRDGRQRGRSDGRRGIRPGLTAGRRAGACCGPGARFIPGGCRRLIGRNRFDRRRCRQFGLDRRHPDQFDPRPGRALAGRPRKIGALRSVPARRPGNRPGQHRRPRKRIHGIRTAGRRRRFLRKQFQFGESQLFLFFARCSSHDARWSFPGRGPALASRPVHGATASIRRRGVAAGKECCRTKKGRILCETARRPDRPARRQIRSARPDGARSDPAARTAQRP